MSADVIISKTNRHRIPSELEKKQTNAGCRKKSRSPSRRLRNVDDGSLMATNRPAQQQTEKRVKNGGGGGLPVGFHPPSVPERAS